VPDALPRLAGTVRSSDTLMAIFVLADRPSANPAANTPIPGGPAQGGSRRDETISDAGEKPVAVGRDGIVAGWTVVDIMDGVVTLERDGRSVTLRLSYSHRPIAAHFAAPKALVLLHDKRTSPFLQP
jgi:hypothetical protein